jgi:primosomal protein N' (replication factor Y)
MESLPASPRRVPVLLPLPLAGTYDYAVPPDLDLSPGDFVRVPLGRRWECGVVWDGEASGIEGARLKEIAARLDAPPLPLALRRFIDWVASYTLSPSGLVLKMAMSVPEALEPRQARLGYRLGQVAEALKITPARQRVLALLQDGLPRLISDIASESGASPGAVRGLIEAGALLPAALVAANIKQPDATAPGPLLSPGQQAAADALVHSQGFCVTLLDGVTGSGKTEVYFEAIAAAMKAGRQALVLLPEIALSAQWLERFARRFAAPPAVWHSDIKGSERRAVWRDVAEGKALVVVGARSALFLPFRDLGLIVADEEHDQAFKQEEGVIYHARDMAVVRARLSDIPIILASATPSIETMTNVQQGRYRLLHLPNRHAGASLPEVTVADLRSDPPPRGRWLSPPLVQAIQETLAAGEQVMLFLNRRGYAPLTLCRSCGHRLQCPNCSAWLVEHRRETRLVCHHCGHQTKPPASCPACGGEAHLVACGPGVERLAEEVERLFPEARMAQMTSDTVTGPEAAASLVRRMAAREIDLLIGTQIMAKGHHFPRLTLVGVVDADLGLAGGDLRAAEKSFQMLSQVAGRAGREERPGRVVLQTYQPGHPVMLALASGDRDRFLAAEAEERRLCGMPPFGRLAAIIVSAQESAAADRAARELARIAPRAEGVEVLGPAPAPMSLLRGRHRRRLLLKTGRAVALQKVLRGWLAAYKAPRDVRIQVDVDPYSFF